MAKVELLFKSKNGRNAFGVWSLNTQLCKLFSGFYKAITTKSLNQKSKGTQHLFLKNSWYL